ncbi:DUF3592 domain-containing protein [Hyalangium versicolor]|uniref:DUF3592 domain-containing protein n=1 Tax=Hyalangium versicolor TaxID=2861190 RepID=UPI001CCB478C|nr:DUF3592 domain-containing protein [Hyalangium versicolor]
MVKSLLLGLGMLVFGAALAFGGGRTLYRAHASQRWPIAEAKVVRSTVERQRSRRSVSFLPHVSYEYSVGGKPYTAETLAFGAGVSAGAMDDANAYVSHYPVGSKVQIHYAPDDAAMACLDCGRVSAADYLIAVGGSALLVLAVLGLIETFRSGRKARNRGMGRPAMGKARV